MTKAELATQVARASGVSPKLAAAVLDALARTIRDEAARGGKAAIPGLGRFTAVERPGRTGRHPRTGESIAIPAHRRLRFSPTQAVRDALNPLHPKETANKENNPDPAAKARASWWTTYWV